MSLKVVRRKQTGALTIDGTLMLSHGIKLRVQRKAQSDDPDLAAEEARAIEADLLRRDWAQQTPMALVALRDQLGALDLALQEMRNEMRENLRIVREHVSSEMRANTRLAEERERVIKSWLDRYEDRYATVEPRRGAAIEIPRNAESIDDVPSPAEATAQAEALIREAIGRPRYAKPGRPRKQQLRKPA